MFLLAIACSAPDADSDTGETVVEEVQRVDITDRWWLPEGQLFPEQDAGWCADLYLGRFPDYDGCFGEVRSCRQGIWFESDRGVWRLYDLVAASCTEGAPDEEHAPMSRYGLWEWLGNTTDGDRFRVNAKEWEMVPQDTAQSQLRVTYGEHTWLIEREVSGGE